MEKLSLDVVNMEGKTVGKIDLSPEVFDAPEKEHLVHAVVRWQLAKRRRGTHSTLTRSMMKGGGKKPFKQKGTGNARAGSIISPLWVGGAKTHGPHPRSYEHKLTKQVRKQALCVVLSDKVRNKKLLVLDSLEFDGAKTKAMVSVLKKLGASAQSVALVTPAKDEMVSKSSRNIPKVTSLSVEGVNVYDLMRHKLLIGTKEAFLNLQARILKNKQEA